jgi:hypothetical protein
MTIRQIFYRLVSMEFIKNAKADYQRVIRLMTIARNDGQIPFDWIVDRSRPVYAPPVFSDPRAYAEVVKHSYRRDYWASQPFYPELWCEKDTISGSIAGVTDELGVTVRVGRGFNSTTRAREIAAVLASTKKQKIILYLGDHDPSGRNAEEEGLSRVLRHYRKIIGNSQASDVKLRRLAIHQEDIKKFNLPPLRVKDTDSRTPGFIRKYGHDCVELDALPPNELRKRIRAAVTALLDRAAWERAIAVEKVELASIVDTVSNWPGFHSAKVMKRRFEFEVIAECQQFLLHDYAADEADKIPEWTGEASERLLALRPGIMSVGTISDSLVRVVLEIAESRPDEDLSGWDQVNEATIEVRSGCLIVAGIGDDLSDARRIELKAGSYRARLHYGNLGLLTSDGLSSEHYKVVLWISKPEPPLVLKQRTGVPEGRTN